MAAALQPLSQDDVAQFQAQLNDDFSVLLDVGRNHPDWNLPVMYGEMLDELRPWKARFERAGRLNNYEDALDRLHRTFEEAENLRASHIPQNALPPLVVQFRQHIEQAKQILSDLATTETAQVGPTKRDENSWKNFMAPS